MLTITCAVYEIVRICEPDLPKLQQEIDNVTQWSKKNLLFHCVIFINQPLSQPLIVNNQPLEVVNTTQLLGIYFTCDLEWTYIRYISSKASKFLYALRILRRNGVQPSDLTTVYCSFVRPVVEYACPVWRTSSVGNFSSLP